MKGLIIISHGSRSEKVGEDMEALAASLEEGLGFSVISCFMELIGPTMEDGVAGLVGNGCQEILVLPLFFVEGKHMKKDIPEQYHICQKKYPNVSISLCEHLGGHELFPQLLTTLIKSIM